MATIFPTEYWLQKYGIVSQPHNTYRTDINYYCVVDAGVVQNILGLPADFIYPWGVLIFLNSMQSGAMRMLIYIPDNNGLPYHLLIKQGWNADDPEAFKKKTWYKLTVTSGEQYPKPSYNNGSKGFGPNIRDPLRPMEP